MSNDNAGVWIDHRRAVVVVVTPAAAHTVVITSKVEKHPERSGDSPLKGPYEAAQVQPDNRRQRALTGALNIYYDTVIAALGNVDSQVIFGPGEAKTELRKRLVKKGLGGRIAAVDTVDKLTNRQIVARVRAYFAGPWSAKAPKHGRANAGLQGKSGRDVVTGGAGRAKRSAKLPRKPARVGGR